MELIWERFKILKLFKGTFFGKKIAFWIEKGNDEVRYLENRLGIDNELHFEFNEKKQFNCLSKPVPYCLSDAKGRPSTINKMEALKNEVSILHRYYEPEMAKILQFLYPGLAVESFCQIDGRFHWLKYYLCDEQRWFFISSIENSATENSVSTRWCILLCQTRIKTVLFRTDLYLKISGWNNDLKINI